jgi:hypothetical protein
MTRRPDPVRVATDFLQERLAEGPVLVSELDWTATRPLASARGPRLPRWQSPHIQTEGPRGSFDVFALLSHS